MENAILFAPELICLIMGLVLFFCTVLNRSYRTTRGIAIAAGIAMIAACLWTLPLEGEPFFPGIYAVDFFSQLIKTALAVGFLFVVIASANPLTVDRNGWLEVPLFFIFSTLGMMMMVSATELLTLYVAMELAAYPVYILVALHRNADIGGESAAKYMVQGMAASAISLYGMSFLFGTFGTTYFSAISIPHAAAQPIFYLGLLLTLAGFFFKLGAFPFHFWAPDTYQIAPPSRHHIHRHRFQNRRHRHPLPPTIPRHARWLGIGPRPNRAHVGKHHRNEPGQPRRTRAKRPQTPARILHSRPRWIRNPRPANLRRMGAYRRPLLRHRLLCHVFCVLPRHLRNRPQRRPHHHRLRIWPLQTRTLPLLHLAHRPVRPHWPPPPTVGFVGKWFLFSAALQRGQFYLVLIAAINAAVALYYYLLIIRQLYWAEPTTQNTIKPTPLVAITAMATIILVIAMGTLPGPFWDMAARAVRALIS